MAVLMESKIDNETARFLGREWSWNKAALELRDIQPLHGGVRVYLPGWSLTEAFVTRAAPGGQEKKYKVALSWSRNEKEALIRLCVKHNFLTIRPEERPGVPDEARPAITLSSCDRKEHTIRKWAGVADPDFDAIYAALRALAEDDARLKPIRPRFNTLQKGLFSAALALLALLPLPLAIRLAERWVRYFWPEQPGWLLLGLLLGGGLALISMAGLGYLDHGRPRYSRVLTSLPVLAAVNFSLFLMVIAGFDLIGPTFAAWRGAAPLEAGDERRFYPLLGYTALLMIPYFVALAGLIGKRVRRVVDDRF